MNDPIKINSSFKCSCCNEFSNSEIQISFDSAFDGQDVFPAIVCPVCKSKHKIDIQFIYWKRDTNEVYFVFPTEQLNRFQHILTSLNLIFEDFKLHQSIQNQKKLKTASIKYVETKLFPKMISGENNGNFSIGMRNLRFTPALKIRTTDEFKYLTQEENLFLSKNDVAYHENGLSELNKELISDTKKILNERKIPLNLILIPEKQHATTTQGLTEILMIIGSSVVIPILVNVLSNVISKLFTSDKVKKTDNLTIKIQEDGSKTLYYFDGPPDKVIAALEKFSRDTINTVCVPGNCHVVPMVDNIITEPNFKFPKTINNAAKEYQKYFDKATAVEFSNTDVQDEIISAKAKYLMDYDEYSRAYFIMLPRIQRTTSLELLCNFALCLKQMGFIDQANEMYHKAIMIYLQRPDLEDLEKFVGNYNQENLDETYKRMSALADEQESKLSDEERKRQSEEFRHITNSVYDFNLKDLCQEADIIALKYQK